MATGGWDGEILMGGLRRERENQGRGEHGGPEDRDGQHLAGRTNIEQETDEGNGKTTEE